MSKSEVAGRWAAALVAVVVAVGVLGGSDAGAQQVFPSVDQPGVTDTEIRVGGVATVSNDPAALELGTAFDGVEAYFDYINSTEGGVHGRKLVLAAKRDDQLGNNRQEVQGLLTEDNVFAVLPVATPLFTGADLLANAGIPTFGWLANAEWGSEDNPSPPNFFGQAGSFINFKSPGPPWVHEAWLPKKLGLKRVGLVGFNIPQSTNCVNALQKTFEKFGTAKVVFRDTSVPFGNVDYSAQVAGMLDKKAELVITCLDANSAVTLAGEMKKQGLAAPQILPKAYNEQLIKRNAEVLDGSYVVLGFTPFETKPKPDGLKLYQRWTKRSGGKQSENSLYGWLNADLFITGLKAAGPDFTQQKLIDAINQIKDYDGGGILAGVDWTKAHQVAQGCYTWVKVVDGNFKPVFGKPGKPFLCLQGDIDKIPANPEFG